MWWGQPWRQQNTQHGPFYDSWWEELTQLPHSNFLDYLHLSLLFLRIVLEPLNIAKFNCIHLFLRSFHFHYTCSLTASQFSSEEVAFLRKPQSSRSTPHEVNPQESQHTSWWPWSVVLLGELPWTPKPSLRYRHLGKEQQTWHLEKQLLEERRERKNSSFENTDQFSPIQQPLRPRADRVTDTPWTTACYCPLRFA